MTDGLAMPENALTFRLSTLKARKAVRLNQKEIATSVMKGAEAGLISPQYLYNIEHDPRSLSSVHLIRQFSRNLNIMVSSPNSLSQ